MTVKDVLFTFLLLLFVSTAALITMLPHKGDVAGAPTTYGAVTGPDSYFPCESHNGVTTCFARQALRQATSTVCAIKSPAATSTMPIGGVRVTTASSTATIWDLARASTPFATTTAIGTAYNVAGSAMADIQASTSPSAGAATVFPPNTYLVIGVRQSITAGDTAGTGSVTSGYCSATFSVI
jgi:hypothetical protein